MEDAFVEVVNTVMLTHAAGTVSAAEAAGAATGALVYKELVDAYTGRGTP